MFRKRLQLTATVPLVWGQPNLQVFGCSKYCLFESLHSLDQISPS
jgi:hypothetical protein